MKRIQKQAKQILALVLLISFVFVQLPFALFHHHDVFHCSASMAGKDDLHHETHLHEQKNDDCYLCSECVLKDLFDHHDTPASAFTCVSFFYSEKDPGQEEAFTEPEQSRGPPASV